MIVQSPMEIKFFQEKAHKHYPLFVNLYSMKMGIYVLGNSFGIFTGEYDMNYFSYITDDANDSYTVFNIKSEIIAN